MIALDKAKVMNITGGIQYARLYSLYLLPLDSTESEAPQQPPHLKTSIRTSMYFRTIYAIQVRHKSEIQEDKHLIVLLPSFQVENESGAYITFRKRTFQEAVDHKYQYQDIVEACFEETLIERYENFFTFLYESAVSPDQSEPSFRYKGSDGYTYPWPKVNSDLIPSGLMEAIYKIRPAHEAKASDIIKFVRWRLNRPFSNSMIRRGGSEFSMNRVDWYPMPYSAMTITASPVQPVEHTPVIEDSQKEDIKIALSNDSGHAKEPFYRYLFHEAWEQYEKSPLSAIVMTMVVVESAVKQCLIYLNPSRKESLEKEESPPPYKLIKEICALKQEKNFIPKRIRTAIHQATEVRNKIVHIGQIPDINDSNLEHFKQYRDNPRGKAYELLVTVEELIWLLEYGRNLTWAKEFIK